MSRAKRWCYTLNNYTPEEEHNIQNIECEYHVYGKEVGENGTPHLQGFICFKNRKVFNAVKKLFKTDRIHLEVSRGTIEEASEYCKKDGNYFEKGEKPEESHRKGGEATKKKWEEARENAKKGKFEEIPADMWIKYRRSWIAEYTDNLNKDISEIKDIDLKDHFYWIYGPTGTGKSHLARQIAQAFDPDHQPYLKGLNKWWSGYENQKVVIIEEWNPDASKFLGSLLKQWCDKWPFTAETKGGHFVNGIRPERIIITSNWNIDECFLDSHESEPLHRRIREIYKKERETFYPIMINQDSTQAIPPSPLNLASLPSEQEVIIDSGTINDI